MGRRADESGRVVGWWVCRFFGCRRRFWKYTCAKHMMIVYVEFYDLNGFEKVGLYWLRIWRSLTFVESKI
jgi:hypothetical protein